MINARCALAGLACPILLLSSPGVAQTAGGDPADHTDLAPRRSSLVQRPYLTRSDDRSLLAPRIGIDAPPGGPAVFPDEFRTIDGTFNNPTRPLLGSAGTPFLRQMAPAYGDAAGDVPARLDGPSPRRVSNAAALDTGDVPNLRGVSDYLWQWGQFLDHDITETPIADPIEAFDVVVPSGDPWFDPMGTGAVRIPLDRSGYEVVEGRREQVNHITAFIDASNVYGSDAARAAELRTLDGTGMLKTSDGDLMPFNVNGFPNAPTADDPTLFLGGDVRANEQIGLIAMHTLFVREHNHWAIEIRAADPTLSGDEIYERARAIVAAEMQAITYNEFLPLLLGPDAIPPYAGYDPDVDPSITNVFAAAAYRFGHSMLSGVLLRRDRSGEPAAEGDISLAGAFFNPAEIVDHGVDSVLRGLAMQRAQEIDTMVVDEVRNFLFGPPGAGGFDLAALNLQRGRDHGLPGYNDVRVECGYPSVGQFDQINPDPAVWARLAVAYDKVDHIDPWIGMLAEPHEPGAMAGKTLRRVLADQFARLRDGDRFWYEAYLPSDMVRLVERQTLATILRRNTGLDDEIGHTPFMVRACDADLDGDGKLTLFDFLAFSTLFDAGDPRADFDADGVLTIFDFLAFQTAFDAGC
ncbi:MAG: peroxidase family protein [Planctomycetota bacterium]